MHCAIVIPTFNRARQVVRAVDAALAQAYDDLTIAVVDDGSTDATAQALERYFGDPRFVYIRLRSNVGTAVAKNVGLALLPFDAITFHDSDDMADPTKVLLQQRVLALPQVQADPCLNWRMAGIQPSSRLDVGVVLAGHWLIAADGSRVRVSRALSLVDDFFPNLQMNAGPPGDWISINSGLFRRDVFVRAGGFADCIEEDRELRNRLIMNGEIIWLIEQPLMTKIDSSDNLTNHRDTGYASGRRRSDRANVWAQAEGWLQGHQPAAVDIDLSNVDIAFVSRPGDLALASDLPVTPASRRLLANASRLEVAA